MNDNQSVLEQTPELTEYEKDLIKLGRTEERLECLNRRIDAALAE